MTDALKRAARTFLQSALAVLVASGAGFVDVQVWRGAAIAGGAALISWLYNSLEDHSVVGTVMK